MTDFFQQLHFFLRIYNQPNSNPVEMHLIVSDCESESNTAISNSENTHKKLSLYPIAGMMLSVKVVAFISDHSERFVIQKYVRVVSGHFVDRSDLSRCRACVVQT